MFATKRFRSYHNNNSNNTSTSPSTTKTNIHSTSQHPYESNPPPIGTDSCYGVRSLESSVSDWAEDADAAIGTGNARSVCLNKLNTSSYLEIEPDGYEQGDHSSHVDSKSEDNESRLDGDSSPSMGRGLMLTNDNMVDIENVGGKEGIDTEATPTPSYAIPQHSPSDSFIHSHSHNQTQTQNLYSPTHDSSAQAYDSQDRSHSHATLSPPPPLGPSVNPFVSDMHEPLLIKPSLSSLGSNGMQGSSNSGVGTEIDSSSHIDTEHHDRDLQSNQTISVLLPSFASPSAPYTPSMPSVASSIPLDLAVGLRDLGTGGGVSSEPSSPSSFTSLPSYVASVSSVSRTSSPGPGWGYGSAYSHVGHTGHTYNHRPSPTGAPADHTAPSLSTSAHVHAANRLSGAIGSSALGMDFGSSGVYSARDGIPSRTESCTGTGIISGTTGQSQELVLPMLSLPSSSLHLNFPRLGENDENVTSGTGGIRMALIGSGDDARQALRDMAETERLVEVHKHEIGVVRDGKVVATVLTDLSFDQVNDRVRGAYAALDGLLNPALPTDRLSDVQAMVDAYSTRGDWIHLVVVLNPVAHPSPHQDALFKEEPRSHPHEPANSLFVDLDIASPSFKLTSSLINGNNEVNEQMSESIHGHSHYEFRAPLYSGDKAVEPTPRATQSIESQSYFLPLAPVSESSPGNTSPAVLSNAHSSRPAAPLLAAIDKQILIRSSSVSKFLTYRADHLHLVSTRPASSDIGAGHSVGSLSGLPLMRLGQSDNRSTGAGNSSAMPSSPSPVSSCLDVATIPNFSPMPTVSRAYGGGEWEATLSRRLAHRREMEANLVAAGAASKRGRGGNGNGGVGRDRGGTAAGSGRARCTRGGTHGYHTYRSTLPSFSPKCAPLPLFPTFKTNNNNNNSKTSSPTSSVNRNRNGKNKRKIGESVVGAIAHRVGITRKLLTKAFVLPFISMLGGQGADGASLVFEKTESPVSNTSLHPGNGKWGGKAVVVACAAAAAAAVAFAIWASTRSSS